MPGSALLRAKHCAGRDAKDQEFRVKLPMLDREHGESRNCCKREPGFVRRGSRPHRSEHPQQQECTTYRVREGIIETRIVSEEANRCL
jgi:hypothetical protein